MGPRARPALTVVLVLSVLLAIGTATASPVAQKKPNETSPPTPFPRVPTLVVTPVPTSAISEREYRQQIEAARPIQRPPTSQPSDPINLTAYVNGLPDTRRETARSTVIIIGSIREVLPARWNTADGQRPANPRDLRAGFSIFTPVRVDVEQYLKGERPEREFFVYSPGGTVGSDSVRREPTARHPLRPGARVLMFLEPRRRTPTLLDARPLWDIVGVDYYILSADGRAMNVYRDVPLQQLLSEIIAARQYQ